MTILRSILNFAGSLLPSRFTSDLAQSVVPGFTLPAPESERDISILDNIATIGWSFLHIQADNEGPSFSYSLGFYANYGQPEIILLGLPQETAHQLLNIVAIRFAGAKQPYETYKAYDDIADGMRIAFIPVARNHYPPYLGYAGWFYGSVKTEFPALQMVWPDREGRLPWEPGYDGAFAAMQPLLDK